MEKILSKALAYLSYHVKDFQWDKRVKPQRFTCPMCMTTPPTANFIPHTDYQMWCQHCNVAIGNIVDIVRITEDDKSEWSDDEIFKYLGEKYGIEIITKAETEVALEFYKNNNFDMVPIARNTKTPIEKEWPTKNHKDKKEWQEWLNDKLNIGVKTGAISGITVVDIDQDKIPEEINKFIEGVGTLSQKTKNGSHFFFKYEKDLPKTRIEEFKLDVENDGGQVVIFPSIVEDTKRDIELNEIKAMSPEFKEFLLSKIGYKRNGETNNTQVSELITKGTNLQVGEILEGNRHNVFMRLGGILRKDLNGQQTRNVLTLFNQHFCKPPLDTRDFNAIVDSLDKYIDFDEKDLAQKILQYLRIVEESPARDIREALGFKPAGEEKARVDKAISFLVKEQYIIKKQRMFHIIKKIEWKDTFIDEGKEIDYKMPYFHDYATFRDGDMIVIGGGQKVGKCIANGYIITRDGLIDIEKFGESFKEGWTELGDEHLFYGKQRYFFKAKCFFKNKVSKTIKIKTFHGFELEGTPEHPILVKRDNKVQYSKLEDLKDTDLILISTGFLKDSNRKILINNLNFELKKQATHITENPLLPIHLDKELSRFLGLFIADGVIEHNKIGICNSHKFTCEIVNALATKYCLNTDKNKESIYGKFFVQFFRKLLNITTNNITARYKTVPECILQSSKENIKVFLESYIDCDSSSNGKTLGIYTASEELGKQIQLLLLGFGIISKRSSKYLEEYKHYYWNIDLNREMTQKYFSIFKSNKYQYSYHIQQKNARTPEQIDEFTYVDKLQTIEHINKEKFVYDFNVPTYHAFWSNGFISHNSHLAINIIKRLVAQGKKPYYVNLESGNRYALISKQLGLVEGSFWNASHFSPEQVDLEKNAITIIDWLLPQDYSETDKLFQYFAKQLVKNGGNLIIFMQLKNDGSFFAPNMVAFFPAFVCRYFYTDDEEGIEGAFQIDYMREPKTRTKRAKILCRYDKDTKEVHRLEEISQDKGGLANE